MTDTQRDMWVQLQASDDFDAGSIALVGSQYGADAWTATTEDGKYDCFLLTVPGEKSPGRSCLPSGDDRGPYDLQASTTVESDGEQTMVWGMLAEDTTGRPIAILQRREADQQWDWRDQYTDEERPVAEFLDSKGFTGDSLQIIGYDGDTPIWLHQGQQACLILATAEMITAQACGDLIDGQTMGLVTPDVTYSLRSSDMRGPVLTIIRTPPGVTFDDKTGEIVE